MLPKMNTNIASTSQNTEQTTGRSKTHEEARTRGEAGGGGGGGGGEIDEKLF